MGVWGAGLYSGDFALDLRAAVGAVVRLPVDPDRIVEILSGMEPSAAGDPNDEEHATFWLVVADQFARRGIAHEPVRRRALQIIDAGADRTALERLGMRPADIGKRLGILAQLRERIAGPITGGRRRVLAKPQPFLAEIGDVLVYPTCNGKCINPYLASRAHDRQHTPQGPAPWAQDGWGAIVVIDRGRAFDFLAWYRPVTLAHSTGEKPSLEVLRTELPWRLGAPGTLSASHVRKMELERIGAFAIDPGRRDRQFPGLRPGTSAAISDISLANSMAAAPGPPAAVSSLWKPRSDAARAIRGIGAILRA